MAHSLPFVISRQYSIKKIQCVDELFQNSDDVKTIDNIRFGNFGRFTFVLLRVFHTQMIVPAKELHVLPLNTFTVFMSFIKGQFGFSRLTRGMIKHFIFGILS